VTSPAEYLFTSARLGFRQWTARDLDLAANTWGDADVTRFIGGPFSLSEIRTRLEREIAMAAATNVQYWPIFQLHDGAHAGCCGLRPYENEVNVYELGVHLRKEFWRCGYATEACRRVIDYAFSTIRAKWLFAGHHPENVSSRHLLSKLGFDFIGDRFYEPTGLFHPSYELRLTANSDRME